MDHVPWALPLPDRVLPIDLILQGDLLPEGIAQADLAHAPILPDPIRRALVHQLNLLRQRLTRDLAEKECPVQQPHESQEPKISAM